MALSNDERQRRHRDKRKRGETRRIDVTLPLEDAVKLDYISAHWECTKTDALSYVIRRIVEQKRDSKKEDRAVFVVDVNNYQTKKIYDLVSSVELSVRRAKLFRQSVDLPPMTSYERMIVHNSLSNDTELETSSEGEGKLRHIVLKYRGGHQSEEKEDSPSSILL